MHYDQSAIQDRAEDIGEGWSRTILTLGADDTAHSAVSGKWDYRGPGQIKYLIHPSGWTVEPGDTLTRIYR